MSSTFCGGTPSIAFTQPVNVRAGHFPQSGAFRAVRISRLCGQPKVGMLHLWEEEPHAEDTSALPA